jgi:hypothetical protein
MTPRAVLLFAAGLAVLFGGANPAASDIWDVGRHVDDCPDGCNFHDDSTGGEDGGGIRSAMTSLSVVPGDTILVYPGPGNGPDVACLPENAFNIPFNMKSGVTLIAAMGPGTVCIAGAAGLNPGVFFINTSETTVLDGFQVVWDATASGLGGGVGCYTASGVVKNCIIRDCLAGTGSGVFQFLSDVRLENNLFLNNRCEAGAGVIALSTSTPVIVNNTIYGSIAPLGSPGAAVYASDSSFLLDRNIFMASQGGSAIYCSGPNPSGISCNVFWNNVYGPFGGGCADTTGTENNIHANPGFCDEANFDFSMCPTSPAITGPCGIIGYTPPGGITGCASCPTPVPNLIADSWGRIKSSYR